MKIYLFIQIRKCFGLSNFIKIVCVYSCITTISTHLPIIHIHKSGRFLLDPEYWHLGQRRKTWWNQFCCLYVPMSSNFSELYACGPKILVSYKRHFTLPTFKRRAKQRKSSIIVTTRFTKKDLFLFIQPRRRESFHEWQSGDRKMGIFKNSLKEIEAIILEESWTCMVALSFKCVTILQSFSVFIWKAGL